MVHELDYTTTALVLDSWEMCRRRKDYEVEVGSILYRNLFKNSPKTKVLFGFPFDIDTDSDELLLSKRFRMHAAYMIEMLDTALNMLGPDLELLTEILYDLGAKHARYGCEECMYPVMGESLLTALKETLKDGFTNEMRCAWIEMYRELSEDMIQGQRREKYTEV
ncbi:hypothetical protein ACA910_007606 [Epithemia clementina (nom. ined.)]